MTDLQFRVRQHMTRSHVLHLRIGQNVFSEEAKQAMHRVGSPMCWKPETQEWDCPCSPAAVEAIQAAAETLGATVDWAEGLREYAQAHLAQAATEGATRIALERIIRENLPLEGYVTNMIDPRGQAAPPLRHQTIGYHWSQRCGGVLFGWDPGTGKTRGAADAAGGWYRHRLIEPMRPMYDEATGQPRVYGGVLVVCPRTMLRTWERELRHWQNASAVIIGGAAQKKLRAAATPADFHIVNYESLKYVAANLYHGLIIDECHRAANSTQQTDYILSIATRTRRRIGLSGTPMANNLQSLFYPLLAIDGGRSLGASKTAFLENYFIERAGYNGVRDYDAKADALPRISAAVARSVHWVKKEEVLDLPKKTFTPQYLPMTPEQHAYYMKVKREAIAYIQDATVTLEQAQARAMKLIQICQGFVLPDEGTGRHFTNAKTDALMELLDDTLRGRKTIVWAYFNYEIEVLTKQLKKRQINFVRIDGTVTSQRERDRAVDRWNNDDYLQVFVRQYSMSEGVTLLGTKANPCFNTVYMGLSYRYIDWLQSQDRVHRIGQDYPVNYNVLLTEGGIDSQIYDKVMEKTDLAFGLREESKDFYLSLLTS